MMDMINKQKNKHSPFWNAFLMFFFLFDTYFMKFGLPTWITSKRAAVLITLFIVIFIDKKKKERTILDTYYSKLVTIIILMFIYSFVIILKIGRGNGEHIFDSIIKFFIVGLLSIYAFSNYFSDLDEFMQALLSAVLAQCFIIILFFFVPSLQITANEIFSVEEELADLFERGYFSGIACVTSKGALKLTAGMVACIYFILNKQDKFKYIVYFCIIGFVTTMVARTGLLITVVGLFFIIKNLTNDIIIMLKIVISILFVVGIVYGIVYLFGLETTVSTMFGRLLELEEQGLYDGFFKMYFAQGRDDTRRVLPPIMKETIIGTGVLSGTSANGITVNIDGGFSRIYVAMGLPMAIFFYFSLLCLFISARFKIKDKKMRDVIAFIIAFIIIGELKEYFIFDGMAICIFFTLIKLYGKQLTSKTEKYQEVKT